MSVRTVVTLDPMHEEEFTKMSTVGFTSQLTKLDERFGEQRTSQLGACSRKDADNEDHHDLLDVRG